MARQHTKANRVGCTPQSPFPVHERVSCSSTVPNFVVNLRTDLQSCEEGDPSEPVDGNLNLEAGASILSPWKRRPLQTGSVGSATQMGQQSIMVVNLFANRPVPWLAECRRSAQSIWSLSVDSCSMIGIISSKNHFLVKRYRPPKDQPGIAASVG
jgi:hypothetical protein